MRCTEVNELLSSYLDGMLGAAQLKAVDQHLEHCPECREELQLLETTVALLHGLDEVEPPGDLKEGILRQIAENRGQGRGSKWQFFNSRPVRAITAIAAGLLLMAVVVSQGVPPLRMGSDGAGVVGDMGIASYEGASEPGELLVGFSKQVAPTAGNFEFLEEEAQRTSSLQEGRGVQERRVIKRAQLTLAVEDLDAGSEEVMSLVESLGGYVEYSGTWENERQRFSSITIRVPVDQYAQVLGLLENLGRVESKELGGQDVTTEYIDLEARLRNLERQEERFLEILERAGTVEEILNIERELERVRGEIEALKGRLQNLDNLTSLSTINLELRQPKVSSERIAPPGLAGVFTAAGQAAVSTVNQMLNLLGEAVILAGRMLPILPMLALAWWVIERYRRRGRHKE